MNPLHKKIESLSEDNDGTFQVLENRAAQRTDCGKALLIVVHPGDAIDRACDWGDAAQGREIEEFSRRNQQNMAAQIIAKADTHDIVVLHRLSSTYLRQNGCKMLYQKAISQCDAQGTVLYGDDLPGAVRWLTENISGIDDQALEIFMTGAYACADFGCITEIGEGLLEVNNRLQIEVSQHAPTTGDPSNAGRWEPLTDRGLRKAGHRPS